MIGVEPIEQILEACIWSAYVAGERPVSMLLIGHVESGKSSILERFRGNSGLHFLNDVTGWALTSPTRGILARLINNQIKHILVPDMLVPTGRNSDTVETFITFLNVLIEEGAVSIQTYATKLELPQPIRCGFIGAIATEELERRRRQWLRLGFMSRLLPVSYSYSAPTIADIKQSIARREHRNEQLILLNLPDKSVEINLTPEIANKLMLLEPSVNQQLHTAERLYGFRLQKHLQTFALAHALACGRDSTTQEDYSFVAESSRYFNLNHTPI